MSGLRRQKKTARDGTPEPTKEKSGPTAGRKEQPIGPTAGKKSIANCRRTEGNQPSSQRERGNNHQSDHARNARTGPDSPDSA